MTRRRNLIKANDLLPRPLRELDQEILEKMKIAADAPLEDKIKVSLWALKRTYEVLRKGVDGVQDDRMYVMFSGGKDSLVALDLAYEALGPENIVVVYIEITGNTLRDNVEYMYEVVKAYGLKRNFLHLKADRDFYELVARWGWPNPRRRWCMTVFKKNVVNEKLGKVLTVTGVKWKDSGWRRRWVDAGALGIIPGWRTIYLKPIFHWSSQDILEYVGKFIKPKKGIGLCPVYKKIGSSGNCAYCPYNIDPCYYAKLKEAYPDMWEKMLKAEAKVKKGKPFYIPGRGKIGFKELVETANLKCVHSNI